MRNFDSSETICHMIDLFLDNQLPQDEKANLLEIMNSNPQIQKIMDEEVNFRDFIKNNVKRPNVSESLRQSLCDKFK
jgi:hypothetical protein